MGKAGSYVCVPFSSKLRITSYDPSMEAKTPPISENWTKLVTSGGKWTIGDEAVSYQHVSLDQQPTRFQPTCSGGEDMDVGLSPSKVVIGICDQKFSRSAVHRISNTEGWHLAIGNA